MALYLIANGPSPTTAAQVAVTTGTVIKTMLQVKPTAGMRIVEWGVSFSGFAAAAPIAVELIETDVAATVTAHVAAGIVAQDHETIVLASPATFLTLGTAATGYTATAEGTITATRVLDVQQISPMGQWFKQFPAGFRPVIGAGKFGRIRVTAGAAVNAYCYMIVEAWATAS